MRGKRVTHAIVTSSGAIHEHQDDWTDANQEDVTGDINDAFGGDWTGWAEFEIMDEGSNEDETDENVEKGDEVMEDQPKDEETGGWGVRRRLQN